ncbi:MAG: hypothetical protein JW716_02015 [Candidatus Aenigmarchaeota archaeon]|nr:hypothetical protein [Candidatus Aenigmarchaeota archaeon]
MGAITNTLRRAGEKFVETYVDIALQENPVTNLLTDYSGMGRSGGAGTWQQMYVHRTAEGNDVILGYGFFGKDEDRVKNFNDIVYDQNSGSIKGVKKGKFVHGVDVKNFDQSYQTSGAMERLVPYSTSDKLHDKSRLISGIMRNEDAYSVSKSKRTKLTKNGAYTGIDVIDIPTKEGVFGVVNPYNHELGRIGVRAVQSILNRGIFTPLMDLAGRGIEALQQNGVKGLEYDPVIEIANTMAQKTTNALFGIREDFEYLN